MIDPTKYIAMAVHIANLFIRKFPSTSREDAYQEAHLSLVKVCRRFDDYFDPSRGIRPATYIGRVIWNHLVEWRKAATCISRRPQGRRVVSLDYVQREHGDDCQLTNGVAARDDRTADIRDEQRLAMALVKKLSPKDRDIIHSIFFRGETLKQIASRHGCASSWIGELRDQAIARMIRRARNRLAWRRKRAGRALTLQPKRLQSKT